MTIRVGDLVQRVPEERTGNWERWVAKYGLPADTILIVSDVYDSFRISCLKFEGLTDPFSFWHTKFFQEVRKNYTIGEFL